jgi:hypothetical protein
MTSRSNPNDIVIINQMGNNVASNPRARRIAFRGSGNVVRFLFRTTPAGGTGTIIHTADVLMTLPAGIRFSEDAVRQYLAHLLEDYYSYFQTRFTEMGSNMEHHHLDMDGNAPWMQIVGIQQLLSSNDVMQQLGFSTRTTTNAGEFRLFGWFDSGELRDRRSFRYLIHGMDLKTLENLLEDDTVHRDCDRMCMYRMLRDTNPGKPGRPVRMFEPAEVNRWMNDNGLAVGGLTDGLSSDHIQAHAQHFRYGHCAMDLTRSVVNLYIPEGGNRNSNLKTVCYMIVGDHCQRIVDADVIKSVMKTGGSRIGQRRLGMMADYKDNTNKESSRQRSRSLDRVYRVEHVKGNERLAQDAFMGNDAPLDLEFEDREEEFEDDGSQQTVRLGSGKEKRARTYPLAREVDRFVTYTKESEEGQKLIRERCKPTYYEGDDTKKWYYYICTDDDDVEFLYEYLVRVLKLDPLRYARSFNGRCRLIEMQNTRWVASRNWDSVLAIQNALYPEEPMRMCGLGVMAFRMLGREMCRLAPNRPLGLFEAMSQYAPNMHRLMDNLQPLARAKLLQKTFQPPFTNPRDHRDRVADVLIPFGERRRMDVIRCYAACIRRIGEDKDQYPIYDITNRLEPFDATRMSDIPVGHYLVQIPKANDTNAEEWGKWCCFVPGERRMMSHRMVRRLLEWELITKEDIDIVCLPDPLRQQTYGAHLSEAFMNVVKLVYQHPALQDPLIAKASKHLINHLVGLCNGTSQAYSGMRYVFHDLLHMHNLLVTSIGEDQVKRLQMKKTSGRDPLWKVPYEYYEMTSSGLQNRQFHLQPVYQMVLEEQAMLVYQRVRPIPLRQIIQFHVDAVEYRIEPRRSWFEKLETENLSTNIGELKKPEDYWNEGLLGLWKWEEPKGVESASVYHLQYSTIERASSLFVSGRTTYPGQEEVTSLPPVRDFEILEDPESHLVVRDWVQALRTTAIGDRMRDRDYMERLVQDWYNDGQADHADRSGLLLTGPAGTGKTYLLRMIYEYGHRLGLSILRSAFTHSACVQLGFDTMTLSSMFGIDRNNDTRQKLIFSRRFMAHLRSLNLNILMVDEISMIPLNILECLMLYHRMNTNTRIVLGGDFYQLPPVDRQWNRPDDYNFFDYTDVFPYLIFDSVTNRNGQWWQLSECMRTDDPLLKEICTAPLKVGELVTAERFPLPSNGTPIWRFISWRNTTRKACNWYCMERYLIHYPMRPTMVCRLRDVYVEHELRKQGPSGRFRADYFERQYDNQKNRPIHFSYLQDFVYAEGMEVVCRNTLREWVPSTSDTETVTTTNARQLAVANVKERGHSAVVNNRRAQIVYIDTEKHTVTLRWMDLINRRKALQLDPEIVGELPIIESPSVLSELEPRADEWNWADWDVVLTHYDFVFNFVPGFCITTHMAQGETIREHYGLMEWDEIRTKSKMAYVAATRGSHSQLLHIIPTGWRVDPWGLPDFGNGIDVTTQLLCKLYHTNRFDKTARYPIRGFGPLVKHLTRSDTVPLCERCNTASLARPAMFRLLIAPPAPAVDPSADAVAIAAPVTDWYPLTLVCEVCARG